MADIGPMPTFDNAVTSLSARQMRIYDLLRQLVGEATAEFFRDACGLLAEQPPRPTATHLVAHALREVESALRAVLEPSIKKLSGHQNSVNAVLEVLDIDPAAPVAAFWLELGVEGGSRNLPGWAHRSGLDAPRPSDSEFRDLVRDFERMLDEVLERFRDRYDEVFNRLDRLLAVAAPTRADADALRQRFRNNQVTRHYFFSRASAAWLRPLREAGFFTAPPEPVIDDGSVALPSWPETEYLVRVAADDPDGALEAARGVPVTDNSRVTWNLVQIALRLPAGRAVELADQITAAVPGRFGVLAPEPMGALVARLAAGGHHNQAMKLAQALLAAPPPRRGRGAEVMDGYAYAEILRGATTALAAAGGVSWLRFLVELLDNAIVEEITADRRERTSYDGSLGWRPAIEASDTPSEDDPRNSLTDAIRTTAQHLVQSDIATLDTVTDILTGKNGTIFSRLALDLLRDHGDAVPATVGRYLTDATLMSDAAVEREYLRLAMAGAAWLQPSDLQQMIALIGRGPGDEWLQRLRLVEGTSLAQTHTEMWQRDRYAAIEALLPDTERARYLTLVAAHGPAPDPAPPPTPTAWTFRVGSPRSAAQISSMSGEALAEFLHTWQEPPRSAGPRQDRDSLAAAVGESVKADAERRAAEASTFVGLPADYATAIIEAFSRAAAEGRDLDWTAVLPLCAWIDEQARAELDAGVTDRPRRQWCRARNGLLRLVIHACNRHACSREEVADPLWRIVEAACADPDPQDRVDQYDRDALEVVPYDGVRALALRAVVAFASCLTQTDPQADLTFALPLLDRHLDLASEPSLAVRATYGSLVPELLVLFPGWTRQRIDAIFPTTAGREPYRRAAWNALVERRPLSDDAWTLLRPQFERAIDELDNTATGRLEQARAAHLGRHLLSRYWTGRLDLNDPDRLIERFYRNVPPEVAAQLIDGVGRNLPEDGLLDETHADRLMALWEFRVTAVDHGQADPDELAEFTGWFASGAFDNSWSLRQLLAVLKRCRSIELDSQVLRRLADLSAVHAAACLAVLDQWLANEPGYWLLSRRGEPLRSIIASGAAAGQAEATLARKLVSILLERHGVDLRDSLGPPPVDAPATSG